MKNYSAHKLLKMFLDEQHMSYCKTPALLLKQCVCWMHEAKKWRVRMAASVRTRKPALNRIKVHLAGISCGTNSRIRVTNDVSNVTCKHCLKLSAKSNSSIVTTAVLDSPIIVLRNQLNKPV